MNLRGWVAVAEGPHRFAWSNGPQKTSNAAQQQECKFLGESLKKGGGAFFARKGVYLASKEIFCQGDALFLQRGQKKMHKRGPYLYMCTNP